MGPGEELAAMVGRLEQQELDLQVGGGALLLLQTTGINKIN